MMMHGYCAYVLLRVLTYADAMMCGGIWCDVW